VPAGTVALGTDKTIKIASMFLKEEKSCLKWHIKLIKLKPNVRNCIRKL